MQHNTKGFSIVIGMILVVLMSLSAFVILGFILPFAKNIKGVENTTHAYYQAYSGIEQALHYIKSRSGTTLTTESGTIMPTTPSGFKFQTFSSGTTNPPPGEGNSDYDKNFNTLSIREPIQMEVGYNKLSSSSFSGTFRIPLGVTGTLSGGTTPMIMWILSSPNQTLVASGSHIKADDINGPLTGWNIKDKLGLTLLGSGKTFDTFYGEECNGANSGCTLKIGLVNNLVLNNGNPIPYLEYKIVFGNSLPLRYTQIETSGKSYGFQKNLKVRVPQVTTDQAFDFTVFQ